MSTYTEINGPAIVADSIKGNGGALSTGYIDITGAKSDADYTLSAAEMACRAIRLGWTGWGSAHNVVAPTTAGVQYTVINATGYAATLKTSGGTGIAVANGKTAILLCDGTNYVRVTADT